MTATHLFGGFLVVGGLACLGLGLLKSAAYYYLLGASSVAALAGPYLFFGMVALIGGIALIARDRGDDGGPSP